jgi:hypothetical protein
MASYLRGVGSAIGVVLGLKQGTTYSEMVTTEEARDENGDVAAFEDYDRQADVTMDVVYDVSASGSVPNAGATLTFTGGSGLADYTGKYSCRGVDITESNTAYKRLSLRMHRYWHNSLPA